jgi:glycerophosphoryl diester phosphodiesterase
MTWKLPLLSLLVLLAACAQEMNEEGETAVVPPTSTPLPSNLPSPRFDLEGHRGARGLKPENTLPAFETALDLGVTTLELDLHYTADGVVVVWHDPAIDNSKCGLDPAATVEAPDPDSLIKWGEGLMISQLSFEQVKAYRCDRNPEPDRFPEQENSPTSLAGDNYHIISLGELFDFVAEYSQSDQKSEAQRANASRVQFNIETKRVPDQPNNINDGFDGETPGPFEVAILAEVTANGLTDRVIIQSFDHRSLWAVRSVNEQIRLAALTSGLPVAISQYADNGANIWSPNYNTLTPNLIAEAHAAGLEVIPWTVNDMDDMRQLIEWGVDGMISDRPDWLASVASDASLLEMGG